MGINRLNGSERSSRTVLINAALRSGLFAKSSGETETSQAPSRRLSRAFKGAPGLFVIERPTSPIAVPTKNRKMLKSGLSSTTNRRG